MDTSQRVIPRCVKFGDLDYVPRFAYGDQAEIAEVCGSGDGTPLGTGFVRLKNAEMPWTIRYDEVLLVLDGEVSIVIGDATIDAGPRDSIWLPAGTELIYRAVDALVFYAIHPVNWAEGEGT